VKNRSQILKSAITLSLVAVLGSLSLESRACSSFGSFGPEHALFAKNYDWVQGQGLVVVNQRNMSKQAFVRPPEVGFSWVSKYGSVTFNQFGRDLPNGGMNEKGLAIEILWLDSAQFPAGDSQTSLNEVQWIQYLLDTSGSVEEMILNAKKARLTRRFAAIHYLACDSLGQCVAVEPLDGKLKFYHSAEMKSPVLTNSEYLISLAELKKYKDFGGSKELPKGSYASKDRFVYLSAMTRQLAQVSDPATRTAKAFEMLEDVQNDFTTMWKIVYDLKNKQISFKTFGLGAHDMKQLMLGDLNFSCKQAASQIYDIESSGEGSIYGQLKDYNYFDNLTKVHVAAKIVKDATAQEIEAVARFPETTKCLE